MQQTKERLPSYHSRHNIFGVRLVRMVYLAKKVSTMAIVLHSFSSVANLNRNSASRFPFCCCFKVCFATGFLTSLICSRRAHTRASVHGRRTATTRQEQEQTAGQAGGRRLTQNWCQRHHCPSCRQRLHFPVPSILEYTKILNCFGLSLAKQLF